MTWMKLSFQSNNLKPINTDYIYLKNETGKPPKTDLPLLKNDITNILEPQKPVIHSRNLQSGSVTGLLEIAQKMKQV